MVAPEATSRVPPPVPMFTMIPAAVLVVVGVLLPVSDGSEVSMGELVVDSVGVRDREEYSDGVMDTVTEMEAVLLGVLDRVREMVGVRLGEGATEGLTEMVPVREEKNKDHGCDGQTAGGP